MRREGHPLVQLPLFLTDLETGVGSWLPRYGPRASGSNTPYSPPVQPVDLLPLGRGNDPAVVSEESDVELANRMAAAVLGKQKESNGLVEARSFRSNKLVMGSDLSIALLRSLGFESLAGTDDADIRAERILARRGFSLLFGGGVYNRLTAWRSVGALIRAPAEAEVERLAVLADDCTGIWFITSAGCFYQIGPAVFRVDGRSFAALAVSKAG